MYLTKIYKRNTHKKIGKQFKEDLSFCMLLEIHRNLKIPISAATSCFIFISAGP